MSLHTPQRWHESAAFNMTNAQRSHAKAGMQFEESRKARQDTVSDKCDMYGRLNASLQEKVNNSQRLLSTLQWRADSLQDSIKQTCNSFSQLEAAHRAKHAPLQLCVWRLEQRKMRPLREQVRDEVEIALEQERATLTTTQNMLSSAMSQTKGTLANLQANLAEVRHDMNQKEQALSLDEQCLRTTQTSFQSVLKHTSTIMPSGASGWSSSGLHTGDHDAYLQSSHNEWDRQKNVVHLDKSISNKEECAKKLRLESDDLVARCKDEAEKALIRSERATVERLEENHRMRDHLEREIQETDGRINQINNSLSETRWQLGALQEPMALTSTCASLRGQRTMNEQIMDPVSTMINEKHNSTMRANDELARQHQQEKANIQELMVRKQQLMEDLNDKAAAGRIDRRCLDHGSTLKGSERPDFSYMGGTAMSTNSMPGPGTRTPMANGGSMTLFSRTAPLPSGGTQPWGALSARSMTQTRFQSLPPLSARMQTLTRMY